ncbi:MAG: AzlC family ABC transporter permease [Neisseria sp.]|nr:AzlC family ABC transporter permease [Neisseria sp.]
MSEFVRGMKESIPIQVGILPFALILGAQGAKKGMTVAEVPLMTGLNFAGGSEFAAIGLWQDPLPILLIVAVTFMINTRHILMGAAFVPYIKHLPMKKLLPALFFMADECWAMGLADAKKHGIFSWSYYMGVALLFYSVWVFFTFVGAMIGPHLGDIEAWGFGMAFPAVFLVLLRGLWKSFAAARPWFVSLAVAVATYLLVDGAWYVITGTLAGLASAWFWGEKA